MSLNLRQIEVFRAVMTTGSISGASRLLLVSQPAVSRLLSYTESRIGFSLFERIKGRLYPTPEAKKLFREVESVYAGVQRVNTLAHDLAERSQGSVHIVSSPSIGQMLIPQAITAFRERHPDVRCTFTYLGFNYLRDSLLNQQADLGVVILPMRHPNLEVVADMYAACGEPMRIAIEVGSPQNACALVQSGAGLALVDDFSVSSWSQSNFVVRPVAPAPTLVANLVHSRYEPLSKPAQHFVATLRSTMAHHGFQAVEA